MTKPEGDFKKVEGVVQPAKLTIEELSRIISDLNYFSVRFPEKPIQFTDFASYIKLLPNNPLLPTIFQFPNNYTTFTDTFSNNKQTEDTKPTQQEPGSEE